MLLPIKLPKVYSSETTPVRSTSLPRLTKNTNPKPKSVSRLTSRIHTEAPSSREEPPPATSFMAELLRKHMKAVKVAEKNTIYSKQLTIFCETKQPQGFGPGARFGATSTKVGRNIFVFGGQCSDRKNDVKIFNTTTMRWQSLNATGHIPDERFGHSANIYKDRILVFGGAGDFNMKLRIRAVFPRIYSLNTCKGQTVTGEWDTVKPDGLPPDNRRFHSAGIVGCTLIIFGGMAADSCVLGDLSAVNLGIR